MISGRNPPIPKDAVGNQNPTVGKESPVNK